MTSPHKAAAPDDSFVLGGETFDVRRPRRAAVIAASRALDRADTAQEHLECLNSLVCLFLDEDGAPGGPVC